jgi:hypothetical protein
MERSTRRVQTDSTAAILAAIAAAAAANGGIVWLRPGIFKVSSVLTVNLPNISIMGPGKSACMLQPTSAITGDTLRVQMNPFSSGAASPGGTLAGFTIDGTHAGAGAVGLHYGDIIGGTVDITVQNFTGTGSVGYLFDNNTNYTEEGHYRIEAILCTIGVKFQVSGSGTNSFGYSDFDIRIRVGGGIYNNQVGIQVSSAVQIYNSRFRVRGNIAGNNAVGLQMVAGSGNPYGGIGPASQLDIAFEANSPGTPTAMIQVPAFCFLYGYGLVDVTTGDNVTSTSSGFNVQVSGWFNAPGITNTAPSATTASNTSSYAVATAPVFVSGTALQVDPFIEVMLYVEVTTAASLAISLGPTSSPATTIVSSVAAALGLLSIRVPAGWYVKITGTIADLNITAVSC